MKFYKNFCGCSAWQPITETEALQFLRDYYGGDSGDSKHREMMTSSSSMSLRVREGYLKSEQ